MSGSQESPPTPVESSALLSAESISKHYGAFYALRDVSLSLHAGELVAVMGENGAGKSTLMKILAGIEAPSSGTIHGSLRSDSMEPLSQRQLEHYVAIVPQEIDLADDRSVAQNIFMGIEPGNRFFPAPRKIIEAAQEILTKIGSTINPRWRAGDMDSASQQMVLIARALARKAKVVIFDEPTANLSPRESESLFAVISSLKAKGVGILYVSHRIPEVMELSDRIEVLRDGVRTGSWHTSSTTAEQVINSMVGRDLDLSARLQPREAATAPQLVVEGLKGSRFGPVSLTVQPGQVLGVAGLPDSGREELLKTIYGAASKQDGSVTVDGKRIDGRSVDYSVRNGVAYLPGERRTAGIFPAMSVKDNISVLVTKQHTRFGLITRKRMSDSAQTYADVVNVRAPSLDLPITSLSGGNQQKALLARLLATKPKIMLLDEPTRGVDVGAKAEVYSVINALTDTGMAVLLSSSDLPELLSQCHQILVMFRGQIVAQLNANETSEEEIMAYATLGQKIEEEQ